MRFGLLGVAMFAGASLLLGASANGAGRVPVLLELFTSEGCSDCPPADNLLAAFDRTQPVPGAELIVLSEHVDYWNRLGWTDPFSSHQYSLRQESYADRFHRDVYTPQLVVDGRFEMVGSDRGAAASAIEKAEREPKIALAISKVGRQGNQVSAEIEVPAVGRSAVLYAVLAENQTFSDVARGENYGRSLTHVSVARVFTRLGEVQTASAVQKQASFAVPPGAGAKGFRVVAFLVDPATGWVLGAAMKKF